MRIVVLGASGLLGRAVLRRLAREDAEVIAVAHRTRLDEESLAGSRGEQADLLDLPRFSELMTEWRPQIVIHGAAHIVRSGSLDVLSRAFDLNVRFPAFLGRIAGELAVSRIINASSVGVYPPGDGLLDETTPPRPFDFYGFTKYLGEEALLGPGSVSSVVNLRFCGLFGPHRRHGAVHNFAAAARDHGEIPVPDSPSRFQFLSAADAAEAVWAACRWNGEGSRTYNIASREILTLPELAARIAELVPAKIRLEPKTIPQLPVVDITRARNELGWEPRALHDALRSFLS